MPNADRTALRTKLQVIKPFIFVAANDALDNEKEMADYTCDGTDDDVQILAAISLLPASGGKVLLSEGTFNISAPIVLNQSNILLEGNGNSSKLFLSNATNVNVINLGDGTGSVTGMIVRNLYIDGNMANQTTTCYGIYLFADADNALIENCNINNTRNDNIYVNTNCDDVIIRNNVCDTTKVGSGGSNIFSDGTRTRIEGNFFSNADYSGIFVYQNGINAIVLNNRVETSLTDFIRVDGISSIIDGNIITVGATFTGDYPIAITDKTTVSNNTIYIGDLADPIGDGNGIIQSYGKYNSIINNSMYFTNLDVGHWGICTEAPSGEGQNLISGNVIINIAGSPNHIDSRAIQLADNNNVCTSNHIIGFEYGVRDYQNNEWNNNTISSNMFYNVSYPIYFTEGSSLAISSNVLKNCKTGIFKTGNGASKYITISANSIFDCDNEAMILRSIQYSTISGNSIADAGNTADDTYAAISLITASGTNYSSYNTLTGNIITSGAANVQKYGIRENSANDGPNIVVGNTCTMAGTANISLQHVSSINEHNIDDIITTTTTTTIV